MHFASISDPNAFAQLESEWNTLAAACPTATVFQTYAWNAAWWRHFGRFPGRRLCLIAIRDGGSQGVLVGLAPLMTGYWYGTPGRRLSFIGTGASDYLDLLCAPGCEDQVAEEFYAFLSELRGWQVADFQQMREGGFLRAHPPKPNTGLTSLDVDQEPCPYVSLPADWPTFTQGLGKKTRANLSYYDRALGKVYEVDFGAVTDRETLAEEMSRLFQLHQRRWNQRWLPGVFGSARVQAFHQDVAAALLDQDWLRLFYLRLDGETQACLYCFAYGDRFCYYQGGFEPTLAKLSLGTVLTARAIQTAISEGRTVFDFLRGDEPYKEKWTKTTRTNARRLLTRQSGPWGPIIERVQQIESSAEHRAKDWVRRRHSRAHK